MASEWLLPDAGTQQSWMTAQSTSFPIELAVLSSVWLPTLAWLYYLGNYLGSLLNVVTVRPCGSRSVVGESCTRAARPVGPFGGLTR
jgi:hypothetical protein